MPFARFVVFLAGLLLLGGVPAPVAAQESPEAIWRAANDLHNPHSQAVVLKNINEIHALRGAGALNDSQYQAVMFWHQSENLAIARKAVGGLKDYELSLQRPAPDAGAWRTGSDTDFLIRRKDGKPVTLEDIQRVERAYRQASTHEIRTRSGGKVQPEGGRFDTSTDFMVAHDATTATEFSRIATHFAGRGADTYSRIEAARVEAQMRTPGGRVDYLDGGMYVAEMVDQAQRKQGQIDALRRQLSSATPGQRSTHEARIAQLEYERNKYLKRIDSINEQLRGQAQAEFGHGVATAPTVAGMQNLSRQARLNYAQTLGNILRVMPEGPQARQANFVLALQLVDVPAAQRTATLSRLDPKVQLTVRAQLQEFATWRRAEQERVSREDVITVQNFLHQTEFGQQLLRVFGSEIEALTTRPTESSRFMADVYRDLAAIDQTIQNRAQSLAMWLDLVVQARDAKSDAELAIALGRTLASKTYYGMVASYAYTGLVERDATALAKSLILLLCPKAALPQVVQAIGSSVIDLTSSVLFDHQFMVLYVTARFEDGQFAGLQDFQEGPDAVCHFVREALQPDGHQRVEGVFTRALALAKDRNFSQEVLSGVNALGTRAFVRALESTVYGGSASFMGQHHGVQQARAEVARLTAMINDFAEGLGSEVALQADGSWAGLSRFEPAAQHAFRQLFELRVAAWAGVEAALCAAITDALVVRHRADQGLAGGDAAALALLADVERLFRELDIHELGMLWLNYEGSRNVIMRWLGSTDEQRIEAMAALQRYHDAYAAVHEIRGTVEGLHLAASGGAESLYARPLTGSPPLTADPAFDRRLAAHLLQDVMEDMRRHEGQLLRIKRHALNDNRALLDTDFDRQTYQAVSAAVIGLHDARATMDGAAHARQRLYRVQVLATHELNTLHRRAFERAGAQREQLAQLEAAFRAHYSSGDAALGIVPPAAVVEVRATPHTLYAFGLEATHLPPEAVYVWLEDGREIGRGDTLLHAFETPGKRTLSVEAAWSASERTVREGRVGATLTVNIRDDVPASALAIRPPEDLGAVANLGRAYAFRAEITHLPEAARLTWRVNGQTAAGGAAAQLRFDAPGRAIVELSAEWEVPGSWTGHEVIDAPAFIIEVAPLQRAPAPAPEPEPTPEPEPKPEPEPEPRRDDPSESDRAPVAPTAPETPSAKQAATDGTWFKSSLGGGWKVELNKSRDWAARMGRDIATGSDLCRPQTARGAIRVKLESSFVPTPEEIDAKLRAFVEGNGWYPDEEGIRAFSIGKYKGRIITTTVKYKGGFGSPMAGYRDGTAHAFGYAIVLHETERRMITANFSVYAGSCWDNSGKNKALAQVKAARAEALGIIQGLSLHETEQESPVTTGAAVIEVEQVDEEKEEKYQLTLTRVSPASGPVIVGTPVTYKAALSGDKPEGEVRYQFEPHPDVAFTPHEGPSASTTAVFSVPGKVGVWVTAVDKTGTIATSDQVEIEIQKPVLELVMEPKAPLVGQEVKARLTVRPEVKDIDFRWMPVPGNAKHVSTSKDNKELIFYLKDEMAAEIQVNARVPFSGEDLGEARASATAKKYAVTVSAPRAQGPPPRVWKEGVGLVTVDKAIAVDQVVEFSVALQPAALSGPVKYQWKVENGPCRVSNPSSSVARVTANAAGTCELSVTVRDRNDVELGVGLGSFSASVTQEAIRQGEQKAQVGSEAQKLVQNAPARARKGDYDGAIKDAEDAARLDPKNTAARALADKLRKEKERIHTQLDKTRKFMEQRRYNEAQKELTVAKNLNSYYPPTLEMEETLRKHWSAWNQEASQKNYEIRDAIEKKDFGKALEIAAAWRASTVIAPTAEGELKQNENWARKWQTQKRVQITLLREAGEMVKQYDYAGALKRFERGFLNWNNVFSGSEPEYREARELQSRAAKADKRLREIVPLLETVVRIKTRSPADIERGTRLADEALALQPNNQQVAQWRDMLRSEAAESASGQGDPAGSAAGEQAARELWQEAEKLQLEQDYAGALQKYREGLKLHADPAIENRVRTLEKYLAVTKSTKPPAPEKSVPAAPVAEPPQAAPPSPTKGTSPAPAASRINMLGEWNHVGNGHTTKLIVSRQDGNAFSGVMHGNPLINGVVDGNKVTFTRDIPQRQDYTGTLTVRPDGAMAMSGTFTQKGAPGTYKWSSSKPAPSEGAGATGGQESPPVPPTSTGSQNGEAATAPSGWKAVTIGNVSFAVPASWGHKTMEEPDVETLNLYWDGSFDDPLHGVSGGVATDYTRAKSDLSRPRTVKLGGASVLRVDDGPVINLLFPPMSGNRGVALVVFRGPGGNQATVDAVLKTFRVNG